MKKCLILAIVAASPLVLSLAAHAADTNRPPAGLQQASPLETIADLPVASRMAMFNAQGYQDEGKPKYAVQELEDFLKRNPEDDHYLIRFFLANTLSQMDRFEDALQQYETTVKLEPRYKQGWLNLGETAYNLGRYERAAEAIYQGYILSEDRPSRLLYYSAVAYLQAEKSDKSAPLLKELVSGSHGTPSFDWCKALVSVSLALQDRELGDEAVSAMLDSHGHNPDAWQIAFQYAASVSDFKKAAVALTVKGYMTELTREEKMQLADLYAMIKAPAQSIPYYESAIGEGASAKELERLASAYLAAYDTKTALKTLERAIAIEPTARLWSLLGDLHYMDKNYGEAYRAFEKCADLEPANGRAYLMKGYCAIELNRYDDAIVILEKAAAFPGQEETALALAKRAKTMSGAGNTDG
jgi:tetratricopeptide (TPR) repeat protein